MRNDMEKSGLAFGECVDRLVTVDVGGSGFAGPLYAETRKRFGNPLAYTAAKRLVERVRPGGMVVIATGFPCDLNIGDQAIGETDGPGGAAVLARAIRLGLNAIPIIVSEKGIVGMVQNACRAMGLAIVNRNEARKAQKTKLIVPCAIVEEFTESADKADSVVSEMLKQFAPDAVVAIERPDKNEKGVYNAWLPEGPLDITHLTAKVDRLFVRARSMGILTVGIGDAGGDMGLGNIKDYVKLNMPFGTDFHATTEMDCAVVATISDWGAYGVAACIAYLLNNTSFLHTPTLEEHLLLECARHNVLNYGTTPEAYLGRHGMDIGTQQAIVKILHTAIETQLKGRRMF